MNTLETTSITGPYDKVLECIQFTIVDPSKPFVLHDIMAVGQQYTFSLWLMSESDAALMVCEKTITSTNAWSKHAITFTANSTDLSINFNIVGTYYVCRPQLEIGDKATDWAPAPEDQSEEMETRFTIEAGKAEAQFTVVRESIDDLGKAIEEKYSKTITENENGISIGDSDGIYEIQVDNVEGVTIRKNGEVRSQLVDDDFYTGNMVVKVNERAQFGNFAFVPRSDGSLSFLKVGG